jgi:hypothetical protein
VHILDASLARGCVVRLLLDRRILLDPEIGTRYKFAVVLNIDCSEAEIFFALTTSSSDHFEPTEGLRIQQEDYPFFPKETFLNLRQIFNKPLIDLRRLLDEGRLSVEGSLSEEHLREVDMKLRMSALVAGRLKERVLPL